MHLNSVRSRWNAERRGGEGRRRERPSGCRIFPFTPCLQGSEASLLSICIHNYDMILEIRSLFPKWPDLS
jgi:hypothetical protein